MRYAGAVTFALAALVLLPLGARAIGTAPGRAAANLQRVRHHLYRVDIGVNTQNPTLQINKFVPDTLTIHAGDSVEWTNAVPNMPQTVTFGPQERVPPLFNRGDVLQINPEVVRPQGGHTVGDITLNVYSSGALMSGIRSLSTRYTFTFPTPGLYLYRSLFHPSSSGSVMVVPASKTASPLTPDRTLSINDGLRSVSQVLNNLQTSERRAGSPSGAGNTISIDTGVGDDNVSINAFAPAGLTIQSGTTVVWTVPEQSGDPHLIVINPSLTDGQPQPLYTALTSAGALQINPAYANATLVQGMAITGTLSANSRIVSNLIYGSSVNAQAVINNSYSLTFDLPGTYYYLDPFHPGMTGQIRVTPASLAG